MGLFLGSIIGIIGKKKFHVSQLKTIGLGVGLGSLATLAGLNLLFKNKLNLKVPYIIDKIFQEKFVPFPLKDFYDEVNTNERCLLHEKHNQNYYDQSGKQIKDFHRLKELEDLYDEEKECLIFGKIFKLKNLYNFFEKLINSNLYNFCVRGIFLNIFLDSIFEKHFGLKRYFDGPFFKYKINESENKEFTLKLLAVVFGYYPYTDNCNRFKGLSESFLGGRPLTMFEIFIIKFMSYKNGGIPYREKVLANGLVPPANAKEEIIYQKTKIEISRINEFSHAKDVEDIFYTVFKGNIKFQMVDEDLFEANLLEHSDQQDESVYIKNIVFE